MTSVTNHTVACALALLMWHAKYEWWSIFFEGLCLVLSYIQIKHTKW